MRLMIADGSAVVRNILIQGLDKDKDIKVIASVSTCQKLVNNLTIENPDIIICGNDTTEEIEEEALNIIISFKYNY